MTQRVLSVWLPNWPIQRLRAAGPLTQPDASLPIAFVTRHPRRGQVVAACCALARQSGVKVGMSGGEASSLLEATSQTKVQPYDMQADIEALEELAEACAARFSPIVALENGGSEKRALSPQGLLMDVTAIGPLFGNEENLCREVVSFFQERSLHVKIALASNLATAWGLSRSGDFGNRDVLITTPENESQHLLQLPVKAMRLQSQCVETLARLGIERFGQLMRLPREGLSTRLGSDLLMRIDQLTGAASEPLPAFHHNPENMAEADLDYPTRDRELLEHAVQQLVQRLAKDLRRRQHGALRLLCRFDLVRSSGDHAQNRNQTQENTRHCAQFRLGLFNPSADAKHLNYLIAGNFQRMRLTADVHKVTVIATLTGPLMQRQGELIEGAHESRIAPQALSNLLDNLSGRLGRERVLEMRSYKYPVPEDAYRLLPLTGQEHSHSQVTGKRKTRRRGRSRDDKAFALSQPSPPQALADSVALPLPEDPLRRPLHLIKEPIKLNVIQTQHDDEPRDLAKPPKLFRYAGRQIETRRFWGPERIESGPWRGESVRRDYFRIETTDGDWLWVFRKLTTDQWFLHGRFA